MRYVSTRNSGHSVTSAQAILTGLAPDGGLYVPERIPQLDLSKLQGASYGEVALAVLELFLPDYHREFLQQAIHASYETRFEGKAGQLEKIRDGLFSLELWHGPTAAFKDYALQLMPHLLVEARRMLGEQNETMILVATSGDTGKAALEGYKDLPGIRIATFYPTGGTSEIQRLQMATQEGENVAVYAVRGNFDDAQRGVKTAFCDEQLAATLADKGIKLSSANSINWGRLVPQIIYYASTYLQLCHRGEIAMGDKVDFCVPTGNFGDIMAGYYAMGMGVPVGRLICASNSNNVLADFLATGRYNANRDFLKTSSPSMDILVSSNLERLLFHACGNSEQVNQWMTQLAQKGEYQVDEQTLGKIQAVFSGGWADEQQVGEEISQIWKQNQYLCDPHTAVAFQVWRRQPQGAKAGVVLSTASPYKFSGKVLESLGVAVPENEFEALTALEQATATKAPVSLTGLKNKKIRFTEIIDAEEIPRIPLR